MKQIFSEKLRYYLCPLLLGASVCYAVVYALYKEMAIPYTLLFIVIGFGLFRFFDILKNRRIGGLIYTVILIVLVALSMGIISFETMRTHNVSLFRMWLYGADNFDHRQFGLLNALFIGGGFFLTSIVYYFTQVQYRTLGLMLCILFPFIIYSKRAEAMNETVIFFITVIYLITVVHNQRMAVQNDHRVLRLDRSYLSAVAVFVAVTLAVAVTIERPTYLAQLQKNPNYFDYNPNRAGVNTIKSLENPSMNSSQRYSDRNLSDTPLFYFHTNGKNPVYYLRRQAYSHFDGNIWTMSYNDNSELQPYSSENQEYSTNEILKDWQAVNNRSGKNLTIGNFLQQKQGRLYSETFSPIYLPSPFGIVIDEETADYTKYPQGMVLRNGYDSNRKSVLDDSFSFVEQTNDLYIYLKKSEINIEDYLRVLREDSSLEAFRLQEDYYRAERNYSDTENITDNVSQLAMQITKDCYSDIDKASALESYFSENGYLYDENANPEDKSIEYFIFTGKAGVCANYATAMTLMARSVGLPARYVEGFAAFEKADTDTFVIRDKHSHAFVEVYISAVGWITFDPTVSDYRNIAAEEDESQFLWRIWQTVNRFKYLIAVAIFIVILMKSDRFSELIFRIRQLFRTPEQKTLKLYAHVIWLVSFSADGDYSSYTVDMLREYLAVNRGTVPEKLLLLFEKTAFGDYQPTKQEYDEVYAEYKKCYRFLRKIPRKLKSVTL